MLALTTRSYALAYLREETLRRIAGNNSSKRFFVCGYIKASLFSYKLRQQYPEQIEVAIGSVSFLAVRV